MSGTLQGRPLLRCALTVPRWGIWHADAVVASGEALPVGARVELELGGVVHSGTVRTGGVFREEGRYHIVGGADGWAKTVLDRSYHSALGVRRENVVADAAREVGESIGEGWGGARLGQHYARPRGPASAVLEAVAPEAWHVGEDGVTRPGARQERAFEGDYVLADKHLDRRLLVLQAERLEGLVPGAQLEGGVAASIRHELTEDTLRSLVWLERDRAADRLLGALRGLVRWLTAETAFHAVYEYRVVSASGGTVDLRPARGSTGMPALASVPAWAGIAGASSRVAPGSSCYVAFVDGNPTRPIVVAYEGSLGASHRAEAVEVLADELVLGDSETGVLNPTGRFVRWGDSVLWGSPGPASAIAPGPGTPVARARG
jgi:hypothetical protein